MRIHATFVDRVGVTRDILAALGARHLNLAAVEMSPPNAYLDAPGLSHSRLEELRAELLRVEGVTSVDVVDILPGHRRSLQLGALLQALPDPVLAVDIRGRVLLANPAFTCLTSQLAEGMGLDAVLDYEICRTLIAQEFKPLLRDVTVAGKSFLLDASPISELLGKGESRLAGGLVTLYPPSRIGGRLASLHPSSDESMETMLGDSQALQTLRSRASRIARLDAPIMIRGETGTGKELVARACHAGSSRRNSPFLALNCAALPENLAESEFFGYAAGAFTGAQKTGKPGLLELADNGTVFLDEIGEMSPYLQAKLLRFLNDGSFRRVGGDREVKVNVRIMSATHRNLEQMIKDGAFREDLYYRLNVLDLPVPPLRERGMDLELLANHFLAAACSQIRRPSLRLTRDATDQLRSYAWPGNVRQLQNVVFRAAATCDGAEITSRDLSIANPGSSSQTNKSIGTLMGAMDAFEAELLRKLYADFPSSRQLAMRLQASHSAIAKRLRKYGIPEKITSKSH